MGFSNLKVLKIERCINLCRFGTIKISGPQLHSLNVERCINIGICSYSPTIAPKLHSFHFVKSNALEFSNLDSPLLETVDVDGNVDAFLSYPTEKSI